MASNESISKLKNIFEMDDFPKSFIFRVFLSEPLDNLICINSYF